MGNIGAETNPASLENKTLDFLLRYWNEKRGDRAMPSRADIRPSELKEHLGWVMLVEALPDLSDFRYRLVGTLVTQYFLEDGTGKTVTEIFGARDDGVAQGIRFLFGACARDAIVIHGFGDADWMAPGYEKFDCICLPLSDDGKIVNMILHAFVFDGPSVIEARGIAHHNGEHVPGRLS
jgi:hypothetical protein